MSTSLVDKVAIVTGSSRSIGAAIAQRLAEEGANVIINYISNYQAADEVINAINSRGKGKAVGVKADVSSTTGANHLLEETVKAFGKLDILVLNAGIMGSRVLADVDEQMFDSHIQINVKGPLFLTKAAAPLLPAGKFNHIIPIYHHSLLHRWPHYLFLLVSYQSVHCPPQRSCLCRVQRCH